jgi:predicted Zn finger-like uncharacterized protein
VFTQCPSCNTINELSAHDLSLWMGRVRCGLCDETFNALQSLSEHAPTHGAVITSVLAPRSPASGDEGASRLVPPPDEPESIAPAEPVAAPAIAELVDIESVPGSSSAPTPDAPVEADLAESDVESAALDDESSASGIDFLLPAPDAELEPAIAHAAADLEGLSTSSSATRDANDATGLDELLPPRRPARGRAWSIASAALVLLFAAQVVHHARAELVREPAITPYLLRIYAALGVAIDPRWEVERYALLRQPQMTTEHSGAQPRLRLRASFANEARRAQPYPLLRLTLEDRWGSPVAARDFTPSEYLRSDARVARLLAPGEQTQAELLVLDPGKDSVGFSLDLCLADANGAVRCANDAS